MKEILSAILLLLGIGVEVYWSYTWYKAIKEKTDNPMPKGERQVTILFIWGVGTFILIGIVMGLLTALGIKEIYGVKL